jgi:hypothetical protein
MYSPDISQHSPRLYRLGKHYGQPMTALADKLIVFGLARLGEVFPEHAASPEAVAQVVELRVAEVESPFGDSQRTGTQP